MYNKFIIIGITFFFILLLLIFLLNKYKKGKIIKNIFDEWKSKTGGFVEIDKNGSCKGDFYLSFSQFKNTESHIHLIIDECGDFMCYIVKKYNLHSKVYHITPYENIPKLVDNMIENMKNFKD